MQKTSVDYSKLTDQELDKLAAEMLGFEWIDRLHVKDGDHYVCDGSPWNPTNVNNNLAEYYLFRKLNCSYEVHGNDAFVETKIWKDRMALSISYTEDLDQINRTKVIACLEAWEKLK